MVATELAAAAHVTFGETARAAASRGTVATGICVTTEVGGLGWGFVMSVPHISGLVYRAAKWAATVDAGRAVP
jgi:hypothetical protein